MKYNLDEFKIDLYDNLGYLVEDQLINENDLRTLPFQKDEVDCLRESLFMNAMSAIKNGLDIFNRDNLYPHLNLREMCLQLNQSAVKEVQ